MKQNMRFIQNILRNAIKIFQLLLVAVALILIIKIFPEAHTAYCVGDGSGGNGSSTTAGIFAGAFTALVGMVRDGAIIGANRLLELTGVAVTGGSTTNVSIASNLIIGGVTLGLVYLQGNALISAFTAGVNVATQGVTHSVTQSVSDRVELHQAYDIIRQLLQQVPTGNGLPPMSCLQSLLVSPSWFDYIRMAPPLPPQPAAVVHQQLGLQVQPGAVVPQQPAFQVQPPVVHHQLPGFPAPSLPGNSALTDDQISANLRTTTMSQEPHTTGSEVASIKGCSPYVESIVSFNLIFGLIVLCLVVAVGVLAFKQNRSRFTVIVTLFVSQFFFIFGSFAFLLRIVNIIKESPGYISAFGSQSQIALLKSTGVLEFQDINLPLPHVIVNLVDVYSILIWCLIICSTFFIILCMVSFYGYFLKKIDRWDLVFASYCLLVNLLLLILCSISLMYSIDLQSTILCLNSTNFKG